MAETIAARSAEVSRSERDTEAVRLTDASLERGNLCINEACYLLRRIRSVELIHGLENEFQIVQIYISYDKPEKQRRIGGLGATREHVGYLNVDDPLMNVLRDDLREADVPVIEL